MRRVIRLGDSTSHGGKVVSATSHMIVGGIPVARVGDRCTCPKRGHNNCAIVEGDPNWTIDGVPIALEGCKISCGAVLISSMPNAGRVYEGNGAGSLLGSQRPSEPAIRDTVVIDEMFDEDAHVEFKLVDQNSMPLGEQAYILRTADGRTIEGMLDEDGYTRIEGVRPGTCKIEFPNLGLAGTV